MSEGPRPDPDHRNPCAKGKSDFGERPVLSIDGDHSGCAADDEGIPGLADAGGDDDVEPRVSGRRVDPGKKSNREPSCRLGAAASCGHDSTETAAHNSHPSIGQREPDLLGRGDLGRLCCFSPYDRDLDRHRRLSVRRPAYGHDPNFRSSRGSTLPFLGICRTRAGDVRMQHEEHPRRGRLAGQPTPKAEEHVAGSRGPGDHADRWVRCRLGGARLRVLCAMPEMDRLLRRHPARGRPGPARGVVPLDRSLGIACRSPVAGVSVSLVGWARMERWLIRLLPVSQRRDLSTGPSRGDSTRREGCSTHGGSGTPRTAWTASQRSCSKRRRTVGVVKLQSAFFGAPRVARLSHPATLDRRGSQRGSVRHRGRQAGGCRDHQRRLCRGVPRGRRPARGRRADGPSLSGVRRHGRLVSVPTMRAAASSSLPGPRIRRAASSSRRSTRLVAASRRRCLRDRGPNARLAPGEVGPVGAVVGPTHTDPRARSTGLAGPVPRPRHRGPGGRISRRGRGVRRLSGPGDSERFPQLALGGPDPSRLQQTVAALADEFRQALSD